MLLDDDLFGTNASLLDEIFAEVEVSTDSADCVDSQSSNMDEMNEDQEQAPLCEEQCDSADESSNSDSIVSACGAEQRVKKKIKLKNEQLDLQCEWRNDE
jgi:hypothetical protein